MLRSLNHQSGQAEVVVGFGVDYAVYHEHSAPKNNMPRRGLIFANPKTETLSTDDEQAVIDIINGWLELA